MYCKGQALSDALRGKLKAEKIQLFAKTFA